MKTLKRHLKYLAIGAAIMLLVLLLMGLWVATIFIPQYGVPVALVLVAYLLGRALSNKNGNDVW